MSLFSNLTYSGNATGITYSLDTIGVMFRELRVVRSLVGGISRFIEMIELVLYVPGSIHR